MKIQTKEELQYMMAYLNIPYVTIITEEGHKMGKVTRDMKYEGGTYYQYRKGYEHCAFERACSALSADYEGIQEWHKDCNKIFATRLLYGLYSGEKRLVDGYRWLSDIKKCNIHIEKDADGKLVFNGYINDLKNFCSYANDHMSYCQEGYYIENEDVNRYIELANRYGLRRETDADYEWWRVGIVD
jgi:hypothetical protein